MQAKENLDLYSDERVKPQLSPIAQKKFDDYLEKLANLSQMVRATEGSSNSSSWQVWENGLRQIYKEMIYDAFKESGVDIPKGMEVHFAGSLAKAQATEFSDLDAFVLLENEDDIQKVKPVFDSLNNLCQRIFSTTRQLYPDPIGINPSRLIGTPDELFSRLKEGMVADVEATARSILTSKPIFPSYKLGEELRSKIKLEPSFSHFCSAKKFYEMALNDFVAPPKDAAQVSIKSHVMRPLDFVLMGLREEFNLYSADGAHLSVPGTIRLLREDKLIPEEDIKRIEDIYNQAMEKRFAMHAEHRKEHDELPYAEAADLLVEVEKLRKMADLRVKEVYELNDLTNGNLYLENKGRLSKRIDFAWAAYQSDEVDIEHREEALKFLVYAFDIQNPAMLNQQLLTLMADKQAKNDPDYVPGKSLKVEINPDDMLSVNEHSQHLDKTKGTTYLNSVERSDYRIHIQGGIFHKDGQAFDTGSMISHEKQGYAAFALNAKGELSVFSHVGLMEGKLAHSSMNAGSPVVSAGELKIENGKLTAITTHSGHYRPSLFNVYRMLEHLAKSGVDITGIDIITLNDPSRQLPGLKSTPWDSPNGRYYKTPVEMIYKDMRILINENINSINADVKSYKDGGLISNLFRFKDWILGNKLTAQRAELATQFGAELKEFQRELQLASITPGKLESKINEISTIISKYEQANNELSEKYNKKPDSGRLAEKFAQFKTQLSELKQSDQHKHEEPELSSLKLSS